MAIYRHLEVSNIAGSKGEVTVVRFLDRRIFDGPIVQAVGDELLALFENARPRNLLLNLAKVEMLSSAAINNMIVLHARVKSVSGKIRLCNLQPAIAEVFATTTLNTVFEIKLSEKDALLGF